MAEGPAVRPARLAGSWYDKDSKTLRRRLRGWMKESAKEEAKKTPRGRLLAVVSPHAGYRFSGRTAASAYRLVAAAKPKRVFVLGPSHYAPIRAVVVVDGARFATPLGPLTIDATARAALLRHALFRRAPKVDLREHSVEMQMPFIKAVAPNATVVPLIVGALTLHEVRRVADALRALLRPGDLIVASSDFTHRGPRYHYQPFLGKNDVPRRLRKLDMEAFRFFEGGDLPAFWRFKHGKDDTICGFYPLSIVRAILGPKIRGTLLRYDTSGRVLGDYTDSVSYLAVAFNASGPAKDPWALIQPALTPRFLTRHEAKLAVRIARKALEYHFAYPQRASFDARKAGLVTPGRLTQTHGVFVTLKEPRGRLRGCIGHTIGQMPLYRGIVTDGLNAALRDPRFSPVTAGELSKLRIEVTVLTPPRAVSGPEAITIGRDGIILRKGKRGALFLPQVAVEQGWGLRRTLSALAHKAGLGYDGWRGAHFEVFEGYVYEEEGR